MDAIKAGMSPSRLDRYPWPRPAAPSLLVNEVVIAGMAAFWYFCHRFSPVSLLYPQLLEGLGLPRAACCLDTLMGKVGLSGFSFANNRTSHAGIVITRTIANWRDRLPPS